MVAWSVYTRVKERKTQLKTENEKNFLARVRNRTVSYRSQNYTTSNGTVHTHAPMSINHRQAQLSSRNTAYIHKWVRIQTQNEEKKTKPLIKDEFSFSPAEFRVQ